MTSAVPADPLAALLELPGVEPAVTEARAAVDRLLAHRLLRRRSAEISAEASLRAARASAALAGTPLELAVFRLGSPDPAVQGALRVSAAMGEVVATIGSAPLQALARLHSLAAADAVPAAALGRPRAPGPPPADQAGVESVDAPPPPEEVSARLAALAGLLRSRGRTSALVLSAVAHGEVLALSPFGWGNGLVARGLARAVLISRGFDPKAVCPPDVGHAADPPGYRAAAAGYARGEVGPWLRHVAGAVSAGATDSLAACEALLRAER